MVDWGAARSGFYTLEVQAQHECGLSAPQELLVQIVDFPPAAAGVPGPVELCRGQTGVYNTTAVGGVLTDWRARTSDLYAVYAHREHLPSKVRVFVDTLLEMLGDDPAFT